MVFDGSEKLIGRGAQADVVSYRGYAYKIYKPSYPAEWIAFEKDQQRAVNRAGVSSIRYYDTDDDHIVKMDLIEGETLETRASRGDLTCFDILADSFAKIHSTDITGIRMPRIEDTACMNLSIPEKEEVMPILRRLPSSIMQGLMLYLTSSQSRAWKYIKRRYCHECEMRG